ncbi:MAG: DUF559 domain-containing protein [Demequinaceae bacterium]|nr:DUF559 domain-containing protein [Demequinaceae bacterium]
MTRPDSPAEWLGHAPRAASRDAILKKYSRHSLDRDLHAGRICRVLPNTYLATRYRSSFEGRSSAVLLWAGPRVALGGTSAAYAHRLIAQPPEYITVCAPRSARVRGPEWIRVIQPTTTSTPVLLRGLRTVPIGDALLQTWTELGTGPGTAILIEAVRKDRVQSRDLLARVSRYPRLRSRRALLRLLDEMRDGVESYLEHLAATRVFNTAEFRGLRRQHRIQSSGRAYVLDLFDPGSKVAVELDGRAFHGEDSARRRDLERDADLAALGIVTIRLTFEDVTRRPEWCRNRVRSAISTRRRSLAA